MRVGYPLDGECRRQAVLYGAGGGRRVGPQDHGVGGRTSGTLQYRWTTCRKEYTYTHTEDKTFTGENRVVNSNEAGE